MLFDYTYCGDTEDTIALTDCTACPVRIACYSQQFLAYCQATGATLGADCSPETPLLLGLAEPDFPHDSPAALLEA